MFSELQSLLYQAYTTQDNEHQEHILDIINSMHNQYNFYVTLIQIISSKNIPENICQSACVQMRLSISRFWRNDLNENIKNLIIQSIPNLLLGFRPSMFSSLLYMTKVLMNLTLYNGEWNNVFDIIVELLNGDSIDRKNGGLLLFLSLVKSALKNKDKLNSKISFKIAKIVQFIPTILCNENDFFIQYLCFNSTSVCSKIDPNIVFSEDGTNFLPWAQIANQIINTDEIPLNGEFYKLLNCLIKLYSHVVLLDKFIPKAVEFLFFSISLMFKQWDVSPTRLQINVLCFLSNCCSNNKIAMLIYDSIPFIISNYFVPFFVLSQIAIKQADQDPTQFIFDNFVDSVFSDKNDVLIEAYSTLSSIADKYPEVSDLIFSIAKTKLEQYYVDKNSSSLFSAFHMCSSHWYKIILKRKEEAIKFIVDSLPLLKSDSTLAQCSLLLLINKINNPISKALGDFDPNIFLSLIESIQSQKPLVRYFAIKAFCSLYNCHNYSFEFSNLLREICINSIAFIIEVILTTSHDYGDSQLAEVVSVFVKDHIFVDRLTYVLPEMTQTSFNLAMFYAENSLNSSHCYNVFNSLINLVNQIKDNNELEDQICQIISNNCMNVINEINFSSTLLNPFLDLLCNVIQFIPQFKEEFWNFYEYLVPKFFNDDLSNDPNLLTTYALFFHNLFLRDPITASIQCESLIKIGNLINDFKYLIVTAIYNSAFLIVITPDKIPNEYIIQLIEQLPEDPSSDLITNSEYKYFTPFFLLLLRNYSPIIFPSFPLFYEEWITIVSTLDTAYSLIFSYNYISQELSNKILNEVFREEPNYLLNHEEVDSDDEEYETETNYHEANPIQPISSQEKFKSFLNFVHALTNEGRVNLESLPISWQSCFYNVNKNCF